MSGVWKIDIKYFKSLRARKGLAIGVMVSEEDVERCRKSNAITARTTKKKWMGYLLVTVV